MMRVCRVVCLPLPLFPALQNEPWELENPTLAQTLVEAFQLDPETLANEAAAHAANVARAAASNRAARAAAAAARAAYNRVVASHLLATDQASGEDTQPTTFVATEAQGAATPETTLASPHSSQMPVNSEMAASGVPATSSQPQPTSQAQEEVASEGPSTACTFSQAPCTSEVDATRPKTAFLGQKDVFDFGQPAGVSGMAFPRPKRPAPTQEAAAEGPSAASGVPQAAASSGEGAATRPKTTKSGKALAKTRWVEPQNVVATAAAKAKMATSAPEQEGAAATAQNSDEPWARMGGKRTKKVRLPILSKAPLLFSFLLPLSLSHFLIVSSVADPSCPVQNTNPGICQPPCPSSADM